MLIYVKLLGLFVISLQLTDTPTLISTFSSILYPLLHIQHILETIYVLPHIVL